MFALRLPALAACAAALFSLAASPAFADVPSPAKDWSMPKATKDEATGKMQYCAVEVLYDNTTVLVLARAVGDANSIGIGTPTKASFEEGAQVKATVQVDDGTVRRLGATALTPYLVSIGTGKDEALWTGMKKGSVLKIGFPDAAATFEFRLKGSGRAMSNVELCLAGKPIPKPEPPKTASSSRAAPRPQQAAPAVPPNMDPRVEKVLAGISKLLQNAGVQKATFRVPTASAETSVAELFWIIPNELSEQPGQGILGGLYDERANGNSFDDMIKAYTGKMKSKCPGEFSEQYGEAQSKGISRWKTADISCAGDGGANSVALLFFQKGEDFSVFFHEEPATGNGAVFDLRDRLTAVVIDAMASD